MSGFSGVFGLAELVLYILGNATSLECLVVDPVVSMEYNPGGDHCYSATKTSNSKEFVLPPSPTNKEDMSSITKKRMFAKKHLEKEEFRHIVNIV